MHIKQQEAAAVGLEVADIVIAYFFVADVCMRFASAPRSFVTSPWDVFDALVVISYAIVAVVISTAGDGEDNVVVLLLRVLRLLRFHRFLYAMTASSDQDASGLSRRERLINCCRRHICCERWRLEDETRDEWKPPPRDQLLDDDPIAAMKAKRAAQRAAASAPSGAAPGTPPRAAAPSGLGPATPERCSTRRDARARRAARTLMGGAHQRAHAFHNIDLRSFSHRSVRKSMAQRSARSDRTKATHRHRRSCRDV